MNDIASNSLKFSPDKLVPGTSNFDQYLIIGQQAYRTLLYHYVFSYVCQDSKKCGRLIRSLPREQILKSYITALIDNSVWASTECGISQKIRRSFAILGCMYCEHGFDKTFSDFKTAIADDVTEYIKLPIENYTHLLESYLWNFRHINIKYEVSIAQKYSYKDIVYRAVSNLHGTKYTAYGLSRKDAIEKLAKSMAHTLIDANDLLAVAKSQNYVPIISHKFILSTPDFKENDSQMRVFCETYGLDYLFGRFSLLSRSQMGKDIWDRLDADIPDFMGTQKPSLLKRGLIDLGYNLLLLQLLNYHMSLGNLELINLSSLDINSVNIGPEEVFTQINNTFCVESFSELLFEKINAPIFVHLTAKEKAQLGANFISAFFLSNFSPDRKFFQIFQPVLDEFFSEHGLASDLDYRYGLIAFLSAFDIRIDTNHHEVGNGNYHAEIRLGKKSRDPVFICEDESMQFAKKEVWRIAYNSIVLDTQLFLSDPTYEIDNDNFLFIANQLICATSANSSLHRYLGILFAENFGKIGISNAQNIVKKVAQHLNGGEIFARFIQKTASFNVDKYIFVAGMIFEYSLVLLSCFNMPSIVAHGIQCSSKNIAKLYSQITNPTDKISRLLIDADYRLIRQIRPVSDEIAQYALDKNLDAYNYLNTVSPYIENYFKILSEQAQQFDATNLGQISNVISSSVSLCILDSHKPVSSQLENLLSEIEIKRAVFACGYCFASGLKLLKNIINRTIYADIPVEFYVGALQNYAAATPDNLITGIDKTTVNVLNEFLTYPNFSLYTCADRFYHGKLYFFEGHAKSLVCIGSSNISRSAYVSNYELNIALTVEENSLVTRDFKQWVQQLKFYSTPIKELDETMFGDSEIKQDGSILLKQVSQASIQKRISELTNAEVQYRLNLWMSYSPDIIAEDLGILSLPNYIVFVYQKHKLLVLESFLAGNAYFCINYDDSFENIINNIATFSKTEIFEFSQMTKRGYHVQNKFTLERNIRRYFL